jgi:hypothetical protein
MSCRVTFPSAGFLEISESEKKIDIVQHQVMAKGDQSMPEAETKLYRF